MKIYYKIKIITTGLFPMTNFTFDRYIQIKEKIDESIINTKSPKSIFYIENNLINSSFSIRNKAGVWNLYLENKGLFELEIPIEIENSETICDYVLDDAFDRVQRLEFKLRLLTNLNITFPSFKITIYDHNKKKFRICGMINNNTNYMNVNDYDNNFKKILQERIKLKITDEELNKLKENNRLNRALTFYNNSFSPKNVEVRFVLLFSSLEALFNLKHDEIITQEISNYSSKILFQHSKNEKKLKMKLIDYYDIRSCYIHGNSPRPITQKNEIDLKEIVRKVLLMYIKISVIYNISKSEDMKKFLNNITIDKLNKNVKNFADYLNNSDLKSIKQNLK